MRVMVAFEGDGAGEEELSWGQSELYRAMVRQQSWFPLGGTNTLDPATTIEDVAAELAYLMGRFQTMRTRLRFDADGHPRQVVADRGTIALEVVDADGVDPADVAEAVRRAYQETDYDFAAEWPVRMAVVRSGGVLTHQVTIVCHLVTDAFGGAVMVQEVHARETAPPPAMTSLEQARWQRSPAGKRVNDNALRYWEGLLRTLTPPVLDASTDPRRPRHRQGEFDSPAAHLAIRAIAARLGIDTSPVVLALYAIASARVTGAHPVVVRPIVGNRFRPGLARVVANLAQNSLCVFDLAGLTVDEAVDRVRRAALVAYKNAYIDPVQLDDLLARISAERGVDVDVKLFFSDRRLPGTPATQDAVPTAEAITAARARTRFGWLSEQDKPLEAWMLYVDDAPDTLRLQVFADTHYLAPADVEALLRTMEQVAVDAAFDPSCPAGIAAP